MTSYADLRERCDRLKDAIDDLGGQFVQTGEAMRREWRLQPGTQTLVERFEALSGELVTLYEQSRALAAAAAGLPPDEPGAMVTLQGVERILQAVIDAEAERAKEIELWKGALEVLRRAGEAISDLQGEFPQVGEVGAKIARLREAVEADFPPNSHPAVAELVAGCHPVAVLLSLIESDRPPEAASYTRQTETVYREFGYAGMLLVSVAARQCHRPRDEEKGHAAAVPPAVTPAPVAPTPGEDAGLDVGDPGTESAASEAGAGRWPHPEPGGGAGGVRESGLPRPATSDDLPPDPGRPDEYVIDAPPMAARAVPDDFGGQVEAELQEELVAAQPPAETDDEAAPVPDGSGAGGQARAFAASLLRGEIGPTPSALSDLVWHLIAEGRLSLAYHLARCLESRGQKAGQGIPPALIASTLLGRRVRGDLGEIAALLGEHLSPYADSEWRSLALEEADSGAAARLLLAAASLLPALLVPETMAPYALADLALAPELAAFGEYCEAVAQFGKGGGRFDPAALRQATSREEWERQMAGLRGEVEAWYEKNLTDPISSHIDAKVIWRDWLRAGGLIHDLLLPVRENDVRKLEQVREEVRRLSRGNNVRAELDRDNQEYCVKRGFQFKRMHASALRNVRAGVEEAVGYARRWVEGHDERPAEDKRNAGQPSRELARWLQAGLGEVEREMADFARRQAALPPRAAAQQCLLAMRGLGRLLDPARASAAREPDVRHLLHGELLREPTLPLDDGWELLDPGSESCLGGLLRLAAGEAADWGAVLREHHRRGDHVATRRVIEYLAARPDPGVNFDELQRRRLSDLRESLEGLRRECRETLDALDKAASEGLLGQADYLHLGGQVEQVRAQWPATRRFTEPQAQLAAVREQLRAGQAQAAARLRGRMAEAGLGAGHPAYANIEEALVQGDVLTAEEYFNLSQASSGLLEAGPREDRFAQFYPDRERTLGRCLRNPQFQYATLLERVAAGEDFCGQGWGGHAGELLTAWIEARRRGSLRAEEAQRILAGLGFRPTEGGVATQDGALGPGRLYGDIWLEVKTEVIRNRQQCPVPTYGSRAGGRYGVLCVWSPNSFNAVSAEELAEKLQRPPQGGPYIVFYFGTMADGMRGELARVNRDKPEERQFIVVDDVLAVHLARDSERRLAHLFECTLPFTALNPYSAKPGEAPPEMFYGRERELRRIVEPEGSNFVYGGRFLGKTTLLRHVEKEFEARGRRGEEDREVACWVDIYNVKKDADEIWSHLAEKLEAKGVVPRDLPFHRPAALRDALFRHIKDWLARGARRRLLLLLDQADDFLRADELDGYRRWQDLRNLMLDTGSRFKVVIAGLHNVIRATEQPNDALRQSGEPVCVGALLDQREGREARALIEVPLHGLGYRFESPGLVLRVLRETNYYPGLIQLYCGALVDYCHDTAERREGPPYVITAHDLDEVVYFERNNQPGLYQTIRDKLQSTLRADESERYAVIAYALALDTWREPERLLGEGLTSAQVKGLAAAHWPEAFERLGDKEWAALLNEMVGLSILRERGGHYALRSRGIFLLLGREEEVRNELGRRRELPLPHNDPRLRDHDGADSYWRSPLTRGDIERLRVAGDGEPHDGVAVIFGCQAAGLDEVSYALRRKFRHFQEGVRDRESFLAQLGRLTERRAGDVTLLFVPDDCGWEVSWVEEARRKVESFRAAERPARVVFTAGPRRVRALVADPEAPLQAWRERGVAFFHLAPWHDVALREWLKHCGLPADPAARRRVSEVTGNWPTLLRNFRRLVAEELFPWEEALRVIEKAIGDPVSVRDIAAQLGLDDPQEVRVLAGVGMLRDDEPVLNALEVVGGGEAAFRQALEWAERLGLASAPLGGSFWRVDEVVRRVVGGVAR